MDYAAYLNLMIHRTAGQTNITGIIGVAYDPFPTPIAIGHGTRRQPDGDRIRLDTAKPGPALADQRPQGREANHGEPPAA
jgi:hypothetical protein